MELPLDTEIGKLIGVFEQDTLSGNYVAFLKKYPAVVVQAESISEGVNKLYEALDAFIEYMGKKGIHNLNQD